MSKLKWAKQISLRLMLADVVLSHGTVGFVAAYAPHSGYFRDVLNRLCEGLHACLESVRGKRFQLVVGEDLNRHHHTCNVNTWTFETACGLRRRIDFIMCSQDMHFPSAHATCNVDLGLDHRAMTVSFELDVRPGKNRKCARCVKRWQPPLDQQGAPQTCHSILQG